MARGEFLGFIVCHLECVFVIRAVPFHIHH